MNPSNVLLIAWLIASMATLLAVPALLRGFAWALPAAIPDDMRCARHRAPLFYPRGRSEMDRL